MLPARWLSNMLISPQSSSPLRMPLQANLSSRIRTVLRLEIWTLLDWRQIAMSQEAGELVDKVRSCVESAFTVI